MKVNKLYPAHDSEILIGLSLSRADATTKIPSHQCEGTTARIDLPEVGMNLVVCVCFLSKCAMHASFGLIQSR